MSPDVKLQLIQLQHQARQRGDLPFACMLLDSQGQVIVSAGNSINSQKDSYAHAEMVLFKAIVGRYSREFLAGCTLVTSDEPCAMCSGALYWSGVGRLVYGLSKASYYQHFPTMADYVFQASAAEVLAQGGRPVLVQGPFFEADFLQSHQPD